MTRFWLAGCLGALLLLATASSAGAFGFLLSWGSTGAAEGQFQSPVGVATDAAGNVYVSDSGNDQIQKFDSSGQFVRMWGWGVDDGSNAFQICTSGCQAGITGTGNGQFQFPHGVATDAAGNVYVADANERLQKFDSNGNFLAIWGGGVVGAAEGQLSNPRGIALDAAGSIYVAEEGNHRIQVFDSNMQFVRMWGWGVDDGSNAFQICTSTCQAGISGTGDGQFNSPRGIGIDAAGNVYVADTSNDRIQKFASSGNFIVKWGTEGPGDGQLNNPDGIAPDGAGSVYVADQNNDRVQRFDANGNFISVLGTLGSGPGQFNTPDGAAVDTGGNLYIADRENDRVQKFGEAAATAKPSNVFSFGKLKRNKRKGTATLIVNVPNPGELTGSGKGVSAAGAAVISKTVNAPGDVQLLIKAKGKNKRKLNETGKVKIKPTITYRPTGGDPSSRSIKLKLKKKL